VLRAVKGLPEDEGQPNPCKYGHKSPPDWVAPHDWDVSLTNTFLATGGSVRLTHDDEMKEVTISKQSENQIVLRSANKKELYFRKQ
jgi:hypothetical protein